MSKLVLIIFSVWLSISVGCEQADIANSREANECRLTLKRVYKALVEFGKTGEFPIDDEGRLDQGTVFRTTDAKLNIQLRCQRQNEYTFARNLRTNELGETSPRVIIACDSPGNHASIDGEEPIQILWSDGSVTSHRMASKLANGLRSSIASGDRISEIEADDQ